LNLSASGIPEEVRELVGWLIEGKVADLVMVATLNTGQVADCLYAGLDGNLAQPYVTLGALEAAKRDWLRGRIESRTLYQEAPTDD
jgi:hypothetical protein